MSYKEFFANFELVPGTTISDAFMAKGVTDFLSAANHIRDLPYGRNTNKANRLLVLSEGRGTCSGKHALLAELAEEHLQPFELTFGFFKISTLTHPIVGPILEKHGLSYYPELHAYLVSNGSRYDFTGTENPVFPIFEFLKELPVKPAQVESFKEQAHKEFLTTWLRSEGLTHRLNLEQLWAIREKCIAARSRS